MTIFKKVANLIRRAEEKFTKVNNEIDTKIKCILKYQMSGFDKCFYIKEDSDEILKISNRLSYYFIFLYKIKMLSLSLNDCCILLERRIRKNSFIKILSNIINFLKVIRNINSFARENWKEQNQIKLKDVYSEISLEKIDEFFSKFYNVSLKEIENDITFYKVSFDDFYEKVGTSFVAAYFDGRKVIMVTDYFLQGHTIVDGKDNLNSEYLVHELTHYIQFRKTASFIEKFRASLSNLILMITGNSDYYMTNKLENEARDNQEKYKNFIKNR